MTGILLLDFFLSGPIFQANMHFDKYFQSMSPVQPISHTVQTLQK